MDARFPPDEREVNARRRSEARKPPGRRPRALQTKAGGTIGNNEMNAGRDRLHFARERWGGCRRDGGRCSSRWSVGGAQNPARTGPPSPGREPALGRCAPGSRPRLPRGPAGPGSDPQLDAGRRAAVRRGMANGIRQRRPRSSSGVPPGGARSGLPAKPARDDPARSRDPAHRGRRDRDGRADALAPHHRHTRGNGRLDPDRGRRCHRGSASRRRSARLRRERFARVEDAGGLHPGRRGDAHASCGNDDPAAVPRFAGQLEREAVRLSRIVADLLDFTAGIGSELADRIHLDALVREEGQRFEESARQARLTIDVEAASVPAVRGSARDLSLLVRNLLDNAVRYTREEGTASRR